MRAGLKVVVGAGAERAGRGWRLEEIERDTRQQWCFVHKASHVVMAFSDYLAQLW